MPEVQHGAATRIGRLSRVVKNAFAGFGLSPPAFEPPEAASFRAQQIAALSAQTPVIVIATLVNSAITVAVFWDRAPKLLLLLWGGSLWLLSLRQSLKWLVRRGAPPPAQVSPRAASRAAALAAATGALWGGVLALLFPPGLPTYQVFLAFVGGGMAAGAATTLSIVPAAAAGFILPCLLPLVVVFAVEATPAHLGMAAMLTLFAALMLVVARGRFAGFLDSMRRRFENAALLRELAATRGDLLDLIGETSIGFAMFDAGGRLTLWSANFAALAGCSPQALTVGRSFAELVAASAPPWGLPAEGADAGLERRIADGRWVRSSDRPTARGGRISVHIDITDLKEREAALARAADEKDLLLHEMEHRAQNTLATVQAMAQHSLQASASMAEFKEAFEARLGALARGHRALAAGKWESADLRALLDDTLAPFTGGDPGRASLSGEPVRAPARLALALSLVFHELATNASKHGAWRSAAGQVEVSFTLERSGAGQALRLRWRERGAGTFSAPWRQGFGARLIRQVVEYQLGGEARMEMRADGVQWDIVVPWPAPAADEPDASATAA